MSLSNGGFGQFPGFVQNTPPPAVPTPARTAGFTVPVYWAGDRPRIFRYDSVDYLCNPGEVTQIPGSFKHERDAQTGKLLLDRPLVRNLGPDEVAKGLVDLYGDQGLRALTGNPIHDERIKVEARNVYVPWRRAECETIVANHENDCAMAVQAKRRPPRPSVAWREAKMDLDRFEAMGMEGKRYVCTKDGMDFDTESEAFAWVRTQYRGTDPKTVVVDTRQNDPKPEEVEVAEDKPKRRRKAAEPEPRGAEESDPLEAQKRAVFLQAGMDGISLPLDIIEGLKSEDRETVAAAIELANNLLNG